MDTNMLTAHRAVSTGVRMAVHSAKTLKVAMVTGQDLIAKSGSMIAYDGYVQFEAPPATLRRSAEEMVTGEGGRLMLCRGDGDLYLADYGADVLVVHLADEALSVNGATLLACDATLQLAIEPVKGLAKLSGSGLTNLVIRGTGWVALVSRGIPTVLDCAERETYVDPDALVAWTTNLDMKARRTIKAGALIGRGSGEALQVGFKGQGFVVVQPSEDTGDRFKIRG
ncbi:AIM24 family protein [Streptomyces sp. PSKA54]|uniref:AIM24 family protein n=1 Tax=Streptomyces himalayensis subsp. aureolus TaxID=2758039 RepID=A0A7W2HK33_9ACTN|nr:AIM24 family protein [Streptomyces himalayensis]MBA4866762.1 AIM24 family protein [Streptomyces himalayensis subsp. aureolus]